MSALNDMRNAAHDLADAHRVALSVEPNGPDAMWGIWADGGASGIDLIGAGKTESEAYANAIATMRGWEVSK